MGVRSRIIVVGLIVYLLAMVYVARGIIGDFTDGFAWTSPAHGLFPIPFELQSIAPVHQELNIIDSFVYVVFIQGGLWMFWISLGILYILKPFVQHIIMTKRRK